MGVVIALSSVASWAGPVSPTYDTFGTLSGATFGGSGIPNDAVAVDTFGGATVGLTATGRYANPPTSNDGAGTFTASVGGDTPSSYARWNFDLYADPGPLGTAGYFARLRYDFDPAVGTDESLLGTVLFPLTALYQDSWNLGFPFLDAGAPGVTPPTYPSFDPTASGKYSFVLELLNPAGAPVARSAINVNVGGGGRVPDAGATLPLLAGGIGVLGIFRKKLI